MRLEAKKKSLLGSLPMLLPGKNLFGCRTTLEKLLKALYHNSLESPRTWKCNSSDCESQQWYLRILFSVYNTAILSCFILSLFVSKTFSAQKQITSVERSVWLRSEGTWFSNITFRCKSIQMRCLQHKKHELHLKNAINISSYPSYGD